MQAQRVYTTAVAHEVRTPLAMMRLELGNIDHARARKVEQDLDALTHFVGQVTDLGRLEATDRTAFRTIDLAALGHAVVSDVAPGCTTARRRSASWTRVPRRRKGMHRWWRTRSVT